MSAGFNVVDSSCWIEYFMDTAQADFAAAPIEHAAAQLVPAISLFEVHKFLSRQSLTATQIDGCIQVMQRGRVIELTAARAIAASTIAQTHKLAMADAIMYATALEFKATLWTQDVDYQGLPNVQFQAKT